MNKIKSAIESWSEASRKGECRDEAYDALCWALVTASGEDLKQFCWEHHSSFEKLPTPLVVVAARLLANRYRDDEVVVTGCKNIIALYCDRLEEKEAIAGL